MKAIDVGDIVKVLKTGDRRLVVAKRTEIVPYHDDWSDTSEMRTQEVFQLAGEAVGRWHTSDSIEVYSPRRIS